MKKTPEDYQQLSLLLEPESSSSSLEKNSLEAVEQVHVAEVIAFPYKKLYEQDHLELLSFRERVVQDLLKSRVVVSD